MKPGPSLRSPRDDDGAVLVLVLIFVVVVGLLAVALLQQSGAGVVAATTSRRLEGRVQAVNGGVDAAIQMLRADPTQCAGAGSSATLPPLTLDANLVTLTCSATSQSGAATGAGGWAVFLNGTGSILRTQGNANDARSISGPVYNHNTAGGAWDLNADVQVNGGDVLQRSSSPTCPATEPNRLDVLSPAPGLYQYCTGPAISLPAPTQSLEQLWPGAALPTNASAPTQSGSGQNRCTVFSPGRYTSSPSLSNEGVNYLRNGVYFLDNIGNWTIDDWLLGGQPGPGESRQSTIPATCNAGDGSSGTLSTGVVLILGGNSRIAVTSGGRVELHSPRLLPQSGQAWLPNLTGVGVYPIPAGLPSGSPFRNSASTVTGTTPILQVSNNGNSDCGAGGSGGQANGSQLVVHGNIYAPDRCIVSGVTGTGAMLMLRGGVVAGTLELRSSASVSNGGSLSSGAGASSGQRTVVLTATSAATANSKQIRATAVVSIANDANRTTNIASWVVANP
jgi:hypothetical protein